MIPFYFSTFVSLVVGLALSVMFLHMVWSAVVQRIEQRQTWYFPEMAERDHVGTEDTGPQ